MTASNSHQLHYWVTGFPEEYSRFSDANDETDLLSVLSKWSTKSTPTDNRDGRMLSQTFSFPFPQNCTFFFFTSTSSSTLPRKGHLELPLPGPAYGTDLQTPPSSVLLPRPFHTEWKKGIYFINDYVCVYTHKKRTCLPPKLCVYLNCVCQVRQISYGAICPEQMAAIWFHWALESKSSCSQTLLLVLILPRSSHFPKQLLHPLTQRLWKISLHRYILMLNSNFIPLYRCSDARNKLNKNMFSFPGIFVRLNTQIASWWLEII